MHVCAHARVCVCKVVFTAVNLYKCECMYVHVLACMCVKCSLLWTCTHGLPQSHPGQAQEHLAGGGLAAASLLFPGVGP